MHYPKYYIILCITIEKIWSNCYNAINRTKKEYEVWDQLQTKYFQF